jgi:hypothetical protein
MVGCCDDGGCCSFLFFALGGVAEELRATQSRWCWHDFSRSMEELVEAKFESNQAFLRELCVVSKNSTKQNRCGQNRPISSRMANAILLSEQNSMTADGFKDQANHVDGNEWMA